MIAKNYTGASGLRMVNALYNVFPQDGTSIAHIGRSLISEPLLGNKGAKFDGSKLQWLGSFNSENSMCTFWHKSKIKTLNDLLTIPSVVGGIGRGSTMDVHAKLVNNLIGGKMKLVTGYPGGADVNLATERGEVDGRCSWSWSSIQATGADWLKSKKINLVIQFAFKKHPDLMDVPLIRDLVTNQKDRDALDFHLAPQVYGRPVGTGPGVPHARYQMLKKAFWDTLHDPKFLADAKKRRLPINPTSGEDVTKLIKRVYAMPKDIIAHAQFLGTSSKRTQISKAVIPVMTYKGVISKVKRAGRRVSWKGGGKKGKLKVSGSRTKVTIAGKKAKRKALKVGMSCAFKVKGASTALEIACN
jgi:tripartite-type tricarboxylate transporter receptor subunit TctC